MGEPSIIEQKLWMGANFKLWIAHECMKGEMGSLSIMSRRLWIGNDGDEGYL